MRRAIELARSAAASGNYALGRSSSRVTRSWASAEAASPTGTILQAHPEMSPSGGPRSARGVGTWKVPTL